MLRVLLVFCHNIKLLIGNGICLSIEWKLHGKKGIKIIVHETTKSYRYEYHTNHIKYILYPI